MAPSRSGTRPDWSLALPALDSVFGTDLAHHLFHAEPITWARFTEPQITQGLAHFLTVPGRTTRLARTRALLTALDADLSEGMNEARVTAEEPAGGNRRIDLLIKWKDSSSRPHAAIVEAKFDHQVTSGQLPAYREYLRKLKVEEERSLLIVVSPRLRPDTLKALGRNRRWRWIAWRDLLLAHDRALDGDDHDDAFRQFRRTLWDRAA